MSFRFDNMRIQNYISSREGALNQLIAQPVKEHIKRGGKTVLFSSLLLQAVVCWSVPRLSRPMRGIDYPLL